MKKAKWTNKVWFPLLNIKTWEKVLEWLTANFVLSLQTQSQTLTKPQNARGLLIKLIKSIWSFLRNSTTGTVLSNRYQKLDTGKHSSFFCFSIGDSDKKSFNTDNRSSSYKFFYGN